MIAGKYFYTHFCHFLTSRYATASQLVSAILDGNVKALEELLKKDDKLLSAYIVCGSAYVST